MRKSLLSALLLLVFLAPSAAAGLDLTWGACNTGNSPDADNRDLDCADQSFRGQLFGNFQVSRPLVPEQARFQR